MISNLKNKLDQLKQQGRNMKIIFSEIKNNIEIKTREVILHDLGPW